MRPTVVAVVVACVASLWSLAPSAMAEDWPRNKGGAIGIGPMVGIPTGATIQIRFRGPGAGSALNLLGGVDQFGDGEPFGAIDYVLRLPFLPRELMSQHPVHGFIYWGFGGFYKGSDPGFGGARMPLGVQVEFPSTRIHLFAELAFDIALFNYDGEAPSFDAGFRAVYAGGVRLFF